jgi:hypothetical protein
MPACPSSDRTHSEEIPLPQDLAAGVPRERPCAAMSCPARRRRDDDGEICRRLTHGEPIYFVPPLPLTSVSPEQQREHTFGLKAVADKYPFLVPTMCDKSALLTHETIRALWFDAGVPPPMSTPVEGPPAPIRPGAAILQRSVKTGWMEPICRCLSDVRVFHRTGKKNGVSGSR